MRDLFNYVKIRENLENRFSYNVFSLSKKSGIPKTTLYDFLNANKRHNIYTDMYLLLRIVNCLRIELKDLLL